MRIASLILIFILGVVTSCVDPLELDIDKEVNILIVEASISTQPGPHYVRLTRSAKYGSIFDGFVRPVLSAKVTIRDSDGKNYELIEDKSNQSIYYTGSEFVAEVGKSYTLLIRTPNGIDYTSLPERIVEAPVIQEVSAVYESTSIGQGVDRTGLNLYVTYQDDPDEQNFFMWKTFGTYKIETYPENYLARDPNGGPAIIPAPKDCCRDCWVNERGGNKIRIFSDNNVNGSLVTELATFVEDDGVRFTEKYLARIEMHTLTREAYQFLELLNQQLSISGDIFDPPPATLRGNIINLTNPDENVIGYFRASDVRVDSIFLTRDMLEVPKGLLQINDDCREYKNGNTFRPDFW